MTRWGEALGFRAVRSAKLAVDELIAPLAGRNNKKDNENEMDQLSAQADAVVLSRRTFFERAALTGAGIALLTGESYGQTRQEQQKGRQDGSSSDPGPENKSLLAENANSNQPPFTDHGNPGAIWFSFDLAPKRIQAGG